MLASTKLLWSEKDHESTHGIVSLSRFACLVFSILCGLFGVLAQPTASLPSSTAAFRARVLCGSMAAPLAAQSGPAPPVPPVGGSRVGTSCRAAGHGKATDELANTRPAPLPTSPLNAVPSAGSDRPEPSGAIARTSPIVPVLQQSSVKYVAQMDFNSYAVKRGVMGSKTTWFLTLDGVLFSVFKNKSAGAAADSMSAKHTVNVRSHSVTVDVAQKELTLELPGKEKPWKLVLAEEETARKWEHALEAAMHSDIEEFYCLGKTIGGGAFGNVVMAWDKRTGEKRAVKIIQRPPGSSQKSQKHLEHEMDIMRRVDHPGIVRTYAIFNLYRTIYIAMELVAGGDLFDFIATQNSLTESQAIQVIRGILEAVDYLHRQGIVHRDLKPENILCVERKWPVSVKLTDFGFSSLIDEKYGDNTMRTQVGTAYFMAPEILMNQAYGRAVDCFSCGVILYTMLTGRLPFPGLTTNDYWMHVKNGNAKFPPSLWDGINPLAKNLVKGLLNNDPEKRLTAFAALQHEWIWSTSDRDAEIRRDRSNLHSGRRKLQKARAAFWAITMMHKVKTLQESAKLPVIVEAVGGGVKKTGEGIKTGVVKTADGIEKGVKITVEGVEKGVKMTGEGVKKTGEGIKTGVVKTADGIEKGVKVTVGGVEKGVKRTGEVIGEGVKRTGEGVKKTGEGIKTGVEKTADGIEKGVKFTVEGVEKGVKKTGEGVKKTGEVLGQGVKKSGEGVKKTGEAFGQGGKKTVDGIRIGVVKTADGIEKGVRKTGEGVKKTGEVIGNGVKKTGENVKRGSDVLHFGARRQGSSDERTGGDSSQGTPRPRRRFRRHGGPDSSDSSVASRDRSSSASGRRPPVLRDRTPSLSDSRLESDGAPILPSAVGQADILAHSDSESDVTKGHGVTEGVEDEQPSRGQEPSLRITTAKLNSEYYSAEQEQKNVDAAQGQSARQGLLCNSAESCTQAPACRLGSTSGSLQLDAGQTEVEKKFNPAASETGRAGSGKKPSLPKLDGLPIGLSGDDETGAAFSETIANGGAESRGALGANHRSGYSSTGSGKPNLPQLRGLPVGMSGGEREALGSGSTTGGVFGSNLNSIEGQQQELGTGNSDRSDALRKAALLLLASSAAEEQRR